LDTRQEVVMGDVSKKKKTPPPARVWTRGRVEVVGDEKNEKNHLQLAFGREGGGGGG